MPSLDPQDRASSPVRQPPWLVAAVTVLVGAMSMGLVWPQFFFREEPANPPTKTTPSQLYPPLPILNRRVAMLQQSTDPVERDALCRPFAAYARRLDRILQPDARVFLSGMLGRDNASRLRVYFFLRNYLFPRAVEISLDGKAVAHESWFEGVPSDSPDEIRMKGFDVLLHTPANNFDLQILPLTRKGEPK